MCMTKLLILFASVLIGLTGNEIVLASQDRYYNSVAIPVSDEGS